MDEKTKTLIYTVAALGVIIVVVLVGTSFGGGDKDVSDTKDSAVEQQVEQQEEQESNVEVIRTDPVDNPLNEYAELSDVTSNGQSGTADRRYDEADLEGNFFHSVEAELNSPPDGAFYEGWLVRGSVGDANFDFISTGKMKESKKYESRYSLDFSSFDDFRDYAGVVITLEFVEDANPEGHILEGEFVQK